MGKFADRLEPGPVKEWYQRYTHSMVANDLAGSLESEGYILDPKSGLFFRPLYKTISEAQLRRTLVDIAFPRPTDLHRHFDVRENIRVIGGRGAIILNEERPTEINVGDEFHIETNINHAFRPNRQTYLALRVFCDGILNPEQEYCMQRFDQVPE